MIKREERMNEGLCMGLSGSVVGESRCKEVGLLVLIWHCCYSICSSGVNYGDNIQIVFLRKRMCLHVLALIMHL